MSYQPRPSPRPCHPEDEHNAPEISTSLARSSSAPEIVSTSHSSRYMTVAMPVSSGFSNTASSAFPSMPSKRGPRKPLPVRPRGRPLRYLWKRKVRPEMPSTSLSGNSCERQPHLGRFSHELIATHTRQVPDTLLDSSTNSHSSLGLGIIDGSGAQHTDPAIPISGEDKRSDSFVQRLEKTFLKYNSSQSLFKRWLVEILSWVLSAICMCAIIGVLLFLKNKRIPEWPLGLTLNTYVSILSKIAGAALLLPTAEALGQLKWIWFKKGSKKILDFEIFDDASRGPWGSFMLLLRTKGRSLAALGAVITILALALDPFFQQVIDFPERWTSNGLISSVPRVVNYDSIRLRMFLQERQMAVQENLIKSVTDGFFTSNGTQPFRFANGTRAEVPVSCPTSNCTWPAYESLSICSACTDISDMLTFGCVSTRVDWIRNLTGSATVANYPNGTQCGYFLNFTSEMPILMSGYLVEDVQSQAGRAEAGEALLMRALPFTTNPYRQPLYGDGSINFKNIQNKIQDGIFASIPGGFIENVYKNKTPIAQECMLAWCVKRFQSSYSFGIYEEKVIDTFFNDTGVPGIFPYQLAYKNAPLEKTIYIGPGTITAPYGNDTVVYSFTNTSAVRTVNVFDDIFPSFYTAKNASDVPLYRCRTNTDTPRYMSLEFNPWASPNNVTLHLERLSTALTAAIRSSNKGEPVFGKAFIIERYVAVRWEWLALPIGLLISSFIFLAATMYSSSGQDGVWKTSAIATLIYGLPDEMQRKIRSTTETGTPRSRAKELRVNLHPKGWRMSGVPKSPKMPMKAENRAPPGWI